MIRILPVGAACAALLLGACGGPEEKAADQKADAVEKIGEQQADALQNAAKATDAQQGTFEKQADAVEDNAQARADEIRKAAK
jgi:hypothetical protein